MGSQLRVYRQKIRSAKTTKKITRAMELISASRIQKAQQRVSASNPYTRAVNKAVSAVATYSDVDHPLTRKIENPTRAAIVIFTADRGLAGAFSSSVLKEADQLTQRLQEQGQEVLYYLVGRKAVANFKFRQRTREKEWTGGTDVPDLETAREIASEITELFIKETEQGGVDGIYLVGNQFVSMMVQEPNTTRCYLSKLSRKRQRPVTSTRFMNSSQRLSRFLTRCCRFISKTASTTRCFSRQPPSTQLVKKQ